MITAEQMKRANEEFAAAAAATVNQAREAERALELYTYGIVDKQHRQYSCEKREQLLKEFQEADYMAERSAWILSLIRRAMARRNLPDEAVCFFKDGDKWCCVHGDFIDLQSSPAGFGDTFEEAMNNLSKSGKAASK